MKLAVALLVAAAVAAPAQAHARTRAHPVELGVQDDPVLVRQAAAYAGRGPAGLIGWDQAYAALDGLGATAVRMNVPWADVAGEDPSAPLRWGVLDAAVDRARAAGRSVQLTLTGPAPAWATRDGRVSYRRPDPVGFGQFAGAAARHFAGRVQRYSIWNEPNWNTYLLPRRRAPELYRRLYRLAHDAIKAVDAGIEVLIGELAPMSRPEAAMAPLQFLRRLTCSDRGWRRAGACPPLKADGFAHHPYTLRWGPHFPGPGRDDVTTGSLPRLTRALDRLAARGALATPAGRPLDLYLTEWGYHGDSRGIPEPLRSRYIRRGLRIVSLDRRVRQLVWYQLAGPPRSRKRIWDTALLERDGRRRPAFGAVRDWALRQVTAGGTSGSRSRRASPATAAG